MLKIFGTDKCKDILLSDEYQKGLWMEWWDYLLKSGYSE